VDPFLSPFSILFKKAWLPQIFLQTNEQPPTPRIFNRVYQNFYFLQFDSFVSAQSPEKEKPASPWTLEEEDPCPDLKLRFKDGPFRAQGILLNVITKNVITDNATIDNVII
jgi:hypothetical protein